MNWLIFGAGVATGIVFVIVLQYLIVRNGGI